MGNITIKLTKILSIIVVTTLVNTCTIDDSKEKIDAELDSILSRQSASEPNLVVTKYKLPLPADIFLSLKVENKHFNKELLNPVSRLSKYNTSISKAINFGVYAADLAYCTVFDQYQESFLYFLSTKKLADDLRIHKGYSQAIIDRMNNNRANPDSLLTIATNTYWKACEYLEENENINILPFIVASGWLESVYLGVENIDLKKKDSILPEIVAKQRKSLNSLTEYLFEVMLDSNTFEVNEDIQEMAIKLADLKISFDKLDQNPKETVMTQEQVNEIKGKLNSIRNEFIL